MNTRRFQFTIEVEVDLDANTWHAAAFWQQMVEHVRGLMPSLAERFMHDEYGVTGKATSYETQIR